jgi:hypothetical protein
MSDLAIKRWWWSKEYKSHSRTRHTGQNIHPGIIIHTQLDYFGHRHTPFIHIVVGGSGFQRGTTVATNNTMPSEQERQIAELVGRSWISKRSKRERAEASICLCRARAFWRPWSGISLLRSRSQVIARSNSAGRLVTDVELSRSSPVIALREILCLTNNGFWLLLITIQLSRQSTTTSSFSNVTGTSNTPLEREQV